MVDRTDGLLYETGQGYSALDAQSARDRLDGYAVVLGLDVSPGGSLSVDVTAGEAIVGTDTNGDTITVSSGSTQTVSLAAADSANPRKDTVWIDDTGTAQVATGTAESALPEGNSRFNTFQPEPPFTGGDGTILAEVFVAAGASSLTSADVRDRRQPAQIVGADAQVASVTGASGTGVYDDDTQTVGDGTTSADHESVSTEAIMNGPIYAGNFSGADADARLDNAISASESGKVILLEDGSYDDVRTISKDLTLIGTKAGLTGSGTEINAEWILDSIITVKNARAFAGSNVPITVNNRRCLLEGLNAPAVSVNADEVLVTKQFLGSVTFDSGTSGGLVDSSVGTTVTDPDGNNTIGDIS